MAVLGLYVKDILLLRPIMQQLLVDYIVSDGKILIFLWKSEKKGSLIARNVIPHDKEWDHAPGGVLYGLIHVTRSGPL